jgi:hypothetical protein
VSEVRVYAEGGGKGKETRPWLRTGLAAFLEHALGTDKVKVIACGGRTEARNHFLDAAHQHPTALNLLLVDSERPVTAPSTKQHLAAEGWRLPKVADDQLHLMVQTMEAWLVADVEALRDFYGQGFNENALPKARSVEDIAKADLEPALKNATRHTQKGLYHKLHHGAVLLGAIRPATVRAKAPHCDRFLRTLEEAVAAPA